MNGATHWAHWANPAYVHKSTVTAAQPPVSTGALTMDGADGSENGDAQAVAASEAKCRSILDQLLISSDPSQLEELGAAARASLSKVLRDGCAFGRYLAPVLKVSVSLGSPCLMHLFFIKEIVSWFFSSFQWESASFSEASLNQKCGIG